MSCLNGPISSGKYESNHTAHLLSASYADHLIEAMEVLNVLVETELAILLANCKASPGFSDLVAESHPGIAGQLTRQIAGQNPDDLVVRALENRAAAVNAANELLSRLEPVARCDSGVASSSLGEPQNSLTWEAGSRSSQDTS